MLLFILPMSPFLLGVILVYGLWRNDVTYGLQEANAGKARQTLP